jgi:hypothetical protein
MSSVAEDSKHKGQALFGMGLKDQKEMVMSVSNIKTTFPICGNER